MTGWRQARTAQQKFPRHATCVAVRISTVDSEIDPDTGEAFFRSTEATTANLSRGGVFVHSWEPLAAGRRVIVALDLPSGGELSLIGQVVWTRRRLESRNAGPLESPGYGVEFLAGTRADQSAIQQILDADPAARVSIAVAEPIPAEPAATTATPPAIAATASSTSSTSSPASIRSAPAAPR